MDFLISGIYFSPWPCASSVYSFCSARRTRQTPGTTAGLARNTAAAVWSSLATVDLCGGCGRRALVTRPRLRRSSVSRRSVMGKSGR